MAAIAAHSPATLARRNRQASKRNREMGLTAAVRAGIDALVWGDATTMMQAAKAAQISDRSLRDAFSKPEVKAHYQRELEVLRNGGRARSIRVGLELLDDARLKKTAAGQKVRLESAKFVLDDPDQRSHGIHINVGVAVQSQPGYQVKSGSDPALIARVLARSGSVHTIGADVMEGQLHRLPADDAKPLIEHEPIATQAEE